MRFGICQSAVFVLSSVFWGSSRWAIIGSVPRCQGSFCSVRFSPVSLRSHAFGGRFDPLVRVALCKGWVLFAVGKLLGARVAHNRRMDAKVLLTPGANRPDAPSRPGWQFRAVWQSPRTMPCHSWREGDRETVRACGQAMQDSTVGPAHADLHCVFSRLLQALRAAVVP